MTLIDTFRSPRFVKFIIVGGFSAIITFISRIILSQFVSFRVAVAVAYLIGMTTAFMLTRKYVFEKSNQASTKQFYYFFLVNVFAAVQVWVVSVGLAEYVFMWLDYHYFREEVAHIIGMAIPAFTSYIGHKKLSFRQV